MPQEGKNNAFESSKNAPVHLEGFLAEFRLAIQDEIKEKLKGTGERQGFQSYGDTMKSLSKIRNLIRKKSLAPSERIGVREKDELHSVRIVHLA